MISFCIISVDVMLSQKCSKVKRCVCETENSEIIDLNTIIAAKDS